MQLAVVQEPVFVVAETIAAAIRRRFPKLTVAVEGPGNEGIYDVHISGPKSDGGVLNVCPWNEVIVTLADNQLNAAWPELAKALPTGWNCIDPSMKGIDRPSSARTWGVIALVVIALAAILIAWANGS